MEKRHYNVASLEAALKALERGYSLSSEDFYRAYLDGEGDVSDVQPRHRLAWATFYERWKSMSGPANFADRIARELEPA